MRDAVSWTVSIWEDPKSSNPRISKAQMAHLENRPSRTWYFLPIASVAALEAYLIRAIEQGSPVVVMGRMRYEFGRLLWAGQIMQLSDDSSTRTFALIIGWLLPTLARMGLGRCLNLVWEKEPRLIKSKIYLTSPLDPFKLVEEFALDFSNPSKFKNQCIACMMITHNCATCFPGHSSFDPVLMAQCSQSRHSDNDAYSIAANHSVLGSAYWDGSRFLDFVIAPSFTQSHQQSFQWLNCASSCIIENCHVCSRQTLSLSFGRISPADGNSARRRLQIFAELVCPWTPIGIWFLTGLSLLPVYFENSIIVAVIVSSHELSEPKSRAGSEIIANPMTLSAENLLVVGGTVRTEIGIPSCHGANLSSSSVTIGCKINNPRSWTLTPPSDANCEILSWNGDSGRDTNNRRRKLSLTLVSPFSRSSRYASFDFSTQKSFSFLVRNVSNSAEGGPEEASRPLIDAFWARTQFRHVITKLSIFRTLLLGRGWTSALNQLSTWARASILNLLESNSHSGASTAAVRAVSRAKKSSPGHDSFEIWKSCQRLSTTTPLLVKAQQKSQRPERRRRWRCQIRPKSKFAKGLTPDIQIDEDSKS